MNDDFMVWVFFIVLVILAASQPEGTEYQQYRESEFSAR